MTTRYECDHADCDAVESSPAATLRFNGETRHLCRKHRRMVRAFLAGEAVVRGE